MATPAYLFTTLLCSLLVNAQNPSPENGGGQQTSPEDGGGPATPTYTAAPSPSVNNAGGASGSSSSFNLSTGGTVAIIVVCVVVGILGIASAVLFYFAKKRQWEVRKSIKRASKRMVAKVDPRQSRRNSRASRPRGMVRMDSPTKNKNIDLEKGESKGAAKTVQTKKVENMEVDDSAVASKSKPQTSEKRFKTAMPDSWTVGGRR